MNETKWSFPADLKTIGEKVTYLSLVLIPARRFDEYGHLIGTLFADAIHYVDPVHEIRGREQVIAMLTKYLPRVSNDRFEFELIQDTEPSIVWRWTIALKVRFSPYEFMIHGLVHARAENGKIVYQREYYDPMESIGVIPMVGKVYQGILKLG